MADFTRLSPDWKTAKPKMHISSDADPPPDDLEYLDDVICEHSGLVTNTSTRRRISAKVSGRDIFPPRKGK